MTRKTYFKCTCTGKGKGNDSVILQKSRHLQKIPKHTVTTQKHQTLYYTTIVDRLRTVGWSNDSHPTGVVKKVYGIPTFPLIAKAV